MTQPLLATLAVLAILAVLTGCTAPSQKQVYRDQPLVAQIRPGMSKQQVLDIGGQPLAVSKRTIYPGSCLDYLFSKSGQQQQTYHVSLNAADQVDHKGFLSCAGRERADQAAKDRMEHSGGGY
jgi:osmotically inducible lipoprotein OsmE